jgi:hypothetical protein
MDDALTFYFNVLDFRVAALLDFALLPNEKSIFGGHCVCVFPFCTKSFHFRHHFSAIFCMSHFENYDC